MKKVCGGVNFSFQGVTDMKNITIVAALLLSGMGAIAQPDTNLHNSTTAALVSSWLQNLKLTPAVSFISGMSNNLGIEQLGPASRDTVKAKGLAHYYNNATLVRNDMIFAGQNMRDVFRNARRAGIGLVRCPNTFPLGAIEPVRGTFNYQFGDSTVKIAGYYGIDLVGTITPWADWADSCDAATPGCNLYVPQADWFYINNNRNGPVCPNDTSAYYTFVQRLVQRYGPGGNMPGLTNPITYWEFGNEPDASSMGQCGSYDSATYVHDLSLTSRAVKAICPTCKIINGGSVGLLQLKDTGYWYYAITHGYQYLNVANFHDNDGRNKAPFYFSTYIDNVNNFQHPLNKVSASYPIWVTEWGLYSGSPGSFMGRLPFRSEDNQAGMYTKVCVWGLANNIANEFYDIIGDTAAIGSAGIVNEGGAPMVKDSARLFFYTQKLLQYKFRNYDSARVMTFDTSTSLAKGDVRVYAGGNRYYVLWGLSSLPAGLSGTKIITNIYGVADTQNVANLVLPLATNPIIVENYSPGGMAEIYENSIAAKVYPNPAKESVTVEITSNQAQPAVHGTYQFTMTDMMGRKVLQRQSTAEKFVIPTAGLSPGMYFYKVASESWGAVQGKIVIE